MLHRAAPLAGARLCRICSHPVDGHPPCGICNDSRLVRLCPACRADPANADWNEREFIVGGADDAARIESSRPVPHGARELMGAPLRPRGPKPVMRRRIILALLERRRERVPHVDMFGRSRGSYERLSYPSRRQIARELGCSHTLVNKVASDLMSMGQQQPTPTPQPAAKRPRARPPADVIEPGVRLVRVDVYVTRERRRPRRSAQPTAPPRASRSVTRCHARAGRGAPSESTAAARALDSSQGARPT